MKTPGVVPYPRIAVAFLLLVLQVASSPPAGEASTTLPGGIVANQTWTAAGSPYLVQGDITIPAGGQLTIQPGPSSGWLRQMLRSRDWTRRVLRSRSREL